MKHTRRFARRGVTLIETMVGILIMMVILFACWKIFMSGFGKSAETTREVALMVGVRGLMENMVKDVNSAHAFLPLQGGSGATGGTVVLKLMSYGDKPKADVAARIQANASGASATGVNVYPYATGGTPEMKYSGRVITYTYDATAKKITRTEENGEAVFVYASTTQLNETNPVRVTTSGARRPPQELATEVQSFEVRFYGYHPEFFELRKFENDKPTVVNAAAIGVSILAGDPPEGTGTPPPGRKRPPSRVEMVTKIWSMRKLYEAQYPEYFSSTDEDLRF